MLDVVTFFPAKDRFALAMKLNNFLLRRVSRGGWRVMSL